MIQTRRLRCFVFTIALEIRLATTLTCSVFLNNHRLSTLISSLPESKTTLELTKRLLQHPFNGSPIVIIGNPTPHRSIRWGFLIDLSNQIGELHCIMHVSNVSSSLMLQARCLLSRIAFLPSEIALFRNALKRFLSSFEQFWGFEGNNQNIIANKFVITLVLSLQYQQSTPCPLR